MPAVGELTAPAANYLLNPRPGPGLCRVCCNLTDGFVRCYACGSVESQLAAVAPISYSFAGGQLHHALAGYKRTTGAASRRMSVELAAITWRFLAEHESCVARAAGVDGFTVVTTVPSGERRRDEHHPLRRIVAELCGPTRARYERLLLRSQAEVEDRAFSAEKYEPLRNLHGESVLLIDDTWTTGTNAQSAAAALRAAGGGEIGVVAIGRYLNREWHRNERRLRAMPRPFDWETCALHDHE
jgi:predicted amidophosphoribosyltransferase